MVTRGKEDGAPEIFHAWHVFLDLVCK